MAHEIARFQEFIHAKRLFGISFVMGIASRDLQSLIASRICHDLISPIGAIGNGLELLSELSGSGSPELMLIDQSARSANAKLRYFRIAFGASRKDMSVGKDELMRILKDMFEESKLNVTLHSGASSLPRPIVKLTLLLILCAEKALPFGGNLEIALSPDAVSFKADSREVRADPELWDSLATGVLPDEIASDQVQFALTAHCLVEMNMRAMVEYSSGTISVGVT